MFYTSRPKVPNILEIVDVNGKTVEWILEKLTPGKQLHIDFSSILDKLSCSMISIPEGNPATMSISFMKKFMKIKGFSLSRKGGDVSSVADNLMSMAGKGKETVTVHFVFISRAYNHNGYNEVSKGLARRRK